MSTNNDDKKNKIAKNVKLASLGSWAMASLTASLVQAVTAIDPIAHVITAFIPNMVKSSHYKKIDKKNDLLKLSDRDDVRRVNPQSHLVKEVRKAMLKAGNDIKNIDVEMINPNIEFVEPIVKYRHGHSEEASRARIYIPALTFLPRKKGQDPYFNSEERVMLLSNAFTEASKKGLKSQRFLWSVMTSNTVIVLASTLSTISGSFANSLPKMLVLGLSAAMTPLIVRQKRIANNLLQDSQIIETDRDAVSLANAFNKMHILKTASARASDHINDLVFEYSKDGTVIKFDDVSKRNVDDVKIVAGGRHFDLVSVERFKNLKDQIDKKESKSALKYQYSDSTGTILKQKFGAAYFPLVSEDEILEAYKGYEAGSKNKITIQLTDNTYLDEAMYAGSSRFKLAVNYPAKDLQKKLHI